VERRIPVKQNASFKDCANQAVLERQKKKTRQEQESRLQDAYGLIETRKITNPNAFFPKNALGLLNI